jgi:hypothetical protein
LNAQDSDLAYSTKARAKAKANEKAETFFHQGEATLPCTMQPTYNYPANVKMPDQYGGFGTVSYLYWFAGQEGMDLATTSTFVPVTGNVLPNEFGKDTKVVFQDSGYSSGFKVGLGYNMNQYDDWVFRADYTWLREHTSHTEEAESAPTEGVFFITNPVLYLTSWFFQNSAVGQPIAAQKLSSSWKMHLDLLDATARRPFYQGTALTMTPYAGLRAAWIRQSLRIAATTVLNVTPPTDTVVSHNSSNSWAIGPHGGIGANWLVGCGFRFIGNVNASLLFTQYTHVRHSEDPITLSFPVEYQFKYYNCLRPMAEMDLGIGWMYYFNTQYALDLSASYDFNYMWGQNMLRTLNDMNIIGVNGASNDLFLHGLRITATLDF